MATLVRLGGGGSGPHLQGPRQRRHVFMALSLMYCRRASFTFTLTATMTSGGKTGQASVVVQTNSRPC